MELIELECAICNDKFQKEKRYVDRGEGKFCSSECFGISRKKFFESKRINNAKCSLCNKFFYRKKSKLDNSKSDFLFCSRKCKDEAQKADGLEGFVRSNYNDGATVYRKKSYKKIYAKM